MSHLYEQFKQFLMKPFLDKSSKWIFLLMNFLFVLIVGLIDYLAGHEIVFPIFYISPIILIAWYIGKREAFAFVVFISVIIVIIDIHHDNAQSIWLPIWNGIIRSCLFFLIAFLFAVLKTTLLREKQISKLRNELLGMASHDILNPINCISLYAELAKETVEKKSLIDTNNYLEEITSLCSYMSILLKEILEFSVMESETIQLKLSQIDYKNRVKDIISLYKLVSKKKNIDIEYILPDEEIFLNIDSHKIDQVLSNIITNSIKYSNPNTKIIVEILIDENMIVTKIKDNGIGIPSNEVEKIFLPFTKTISKPTGGESSTGLGLAIVKRIIDAHKGKIVVESSLNQGTTFTFSLPKN